MTSIKVKDVVVDVSQGILAFELDVFMHEHYNRKNMTEKPKSILRNHVQLEWLDQKLRSKHPDVLMPIFPKNLSSAKDHELIRKLGQQVERYFCKILQRNDLVQDHDFRYFISDEMSVLEKPERKLSVSLDKVPLIGHVLRPDMEHGFRDYHISEFVESLDDKAMFEKRKSIIRQEERKLDECISSFKRIVNTDDTYGKLLQNFGYSMKECLCLKNPDIALDSHVKLSNGFYNLTSQLKNINNKRIQEKNDSSLDLFLENFDMLEGAKSLMNHRTSLLLNSNDAHKTKIKKLEKFEKAKIKIPIIESEINQAREELSKAEQDITLKAAVYNQNNKKLAAELQRFEMEKNEDFKKALFNYASTEIRFNEALQEAVQSLIKSVKE